MQKVSKKLNINFGFAFPGNLLHLTFVSCCYRDTREGRAFPLSRCAKQGLAEM